MPNYYDHENLSPFLACSPFSCSTSACCNTISSRIRYLRSLITGLWVCITHWYVATIFARLSQDPKMNRERSIGLLPAQEFICYILKVVPECSHVQTGFLSLSVNSVSFHAVDSSWQHERYGGELWVVYD